jgi:hypothetical protein
VFVYPVVEAALRSHRDPEKTAKTPSLRVSAVKSSFSALSNPTVKTQKFTASSTPGRGYLLVFEMMAAVE